MMNEMNETIEWLSRVVIDPTRSSTAKPFRDGDHVIITDQCIALFVKGEVQDFREDGTISAALQKNFEDKSFKDVAFCLNADSLGIRKHSAWDNPYNELSWDYPIDHAPTQIISTENTGAFDARYLWILCELHKRHPLRNFQAKEMPLLTGQYAKYKAPGYMLRFEFDGGKGLLMGCQSR